MRILQVVCKACALRFESGVPLARQELRVLERVRTLEVCPRCGTAGDYAAQDYLDPDPDGTGGFPGEGLARRRGGHGAAPGGDIRGAPRLRGDRAGERPDERGR